LIIKILLFYFSKQLFSPFLPENIANYETVKDVLINIYDNFSCNNRKIKERNYNSKKLQRKYHHCLLVLCGEVIRALSNLIVGEDHVCN